jgi:hypothetical protein
MVTRIVRLHTSFVVDLAFLRGIKLTVWVQLIDQTAQNDFYLERILQLSGVTHVYLHSVAALRSSP